MNPVSNCCRPSTSRTGRRSSSSRAWLASEKVFGDPLAAARRWQDAGAEWLHLVDLDAAFGRGSNADVIAGIVGRGWTWKRRAVRRDPRRRQPRAGARDRLPPGEHRHRGAGEAGVV